MSPDPELVTRLLRTWRAGEPEALNQLMPLVYDELRRLASRYLKHERPDHTLQTTELVHELYMRLVGADVDWQDRAHFKAVAGRIMRNILVDHARSRGRAKRGGGCVVGSLDDDFDIPDNTSPPVVDILALHEALERLKEIDQQASDVIELAFFAGLKTREIGHVTGLTNRQVSTKRDMAKSWLARELRNPALRGGSGEERGP